MRFETAKELLAHFGGSLVGKDMSGFYLSGMDLTKANLSETILTDTNLSGIILNNTIGNGKEIRTLQTNDYIVNVCKDRMQIGCKNYSIKEWENFTDEEIQEMASNALAFWNKYKNLILEFAKILNS